MPKNVVRTPYTKQNLDAPEMTEQSNIAHVLTFLRKELAGEVAWMPRSLRKGAKPSADANCFDLVFATSADATRFAFHWRGRMWAGDRTL
jgi:hypothetical protein